MVLTSVPYTRYIILCKSVLTGTEDVLSRVGLHDCPRKSSTVYST